MHWCPITICTDLKDHEVASSGVYLVDQHANEEFVITMSTPLAESLSKTNNRALGAIDVSVNSAQWHDLQLKNTYEIKSTSAKLASFSREFSVVPSPSIAVLVFTFVNADQDRMEQAKHPFQTTLPSIGNIEMISTPFGISHINLFHGYRSAGSVCLIQPDLVLVDGRYLDNMEGGCACLSDGTSIGMIAGSLKHNRKRGSFVLVVPWSTVAKASSIDQLTSQDNILENVWTGVVSVKVQEHPSLISWGSGVLIAQDLVATNYHVVRNKDIEKIEVCLESNKASGKRLARKVTKITRPNENIDLVVLQLETKVDTVRFKPVSLALSNPKVGTRICSVGYGLFLPERFSDVMVPLQSRGLVSQSLDDMLICSASCWNGSSGGAVFEESTGELVGIMSSNATDNSSGESMPDIAFVIPVAWLRNTLHQISSPELAASEAESQMAGRLFKLDRTNKDVRSKL